jgi:WD40 repeat protein/Tfp pilus assembly protein PilF
MSDIVNNILLVIGVIASLATIISLAVPIINRYIYKQELDPKIKARQQKITGVIFSIGLISIISIFVVESTLQQSATASSQVLGRMLYHYEAPNNASDVRALAWSPDSTRIASIDDFGGTIQVWDATTGNHTLTYQPPSWQVNSLSWSPDGKYVAASVDRHLYVLEVDTTSLRQVFNPALPLLSYGNGVVAWSTDGTRIALACMDNTVRVWNINAGHVDTSQKPLIYTHHTKNVYALAWSPDGQYIASASEDNTIQVWQISDGDKTYRTIRGIPLQSASAYSNIAWSPNGELLATEDGRGIVSVWSYQSGDKVLSMPTYPSTTPGNQVLYGGAVAWSPDSQFLGTGSFDSNFNGKIQVVSWLSKSLNRPSFTDSSIASQIYALAWSPNGNYIAAATGLDNGVIVWQARGINDWLYAQYYHIDTGPGGQVQVYGVALGIPLGGLLLFLSLFGRPQLKFVTKRRTFLAISGGLVLGFSILILAIALITFILLPIFPVLTPIKAGLFLGSALLLSCILPLAVVGYIRPSQKRRRARKASLNYVQQGRAYLKQGEYQRAIESYDHALACEPSNSVAYVVRGNTYAEQGEYKWAIEDFNRALALGIKDGMIYFKRGIAYFSLKEYQQAIENYNQAAELAPAWSDIYYKRGLAYLWLKNTPQARIDYLRSSDLNPSNTDAEWKAIWVGMSKQRVNKEIAVNLERIATVDPQQYVATVCRGLALGLRGKVKEGMEEVEKAIPLAPNEWDAYFWKGMLYAYFYQGKARSAEALAAIEQALAGGLPPVLLVPLYWFEKDRPNFFVKYVKPLLERLKV